MKPLKISYTNLNSYEDGKKADPNMRRKRSSREICFP